MSKRLFLPTRFNYKTLKDEPQRFVGFTGDGRVAFTDAGRELVRRAELSHAEASALAGELLSASYDAERKADAAAGHHDLVSKPLNGGRFEVRYHRHIAVFRPIVNGKRRTRRYADPSKAPKGQRCTICRSEAPEGATMYVFESSADQGETVSSAKGELGYHRICEPCMRPDLRAAALGLSLLATQAGGGT